MDIGTILTGIAAILNTMGNRDTQSGLHRLWMYLMGRPDLTYKEDNAAITSATLHKLQQASPPHIAVVGMTSAGKSSLINVLFGSPIAEVKGTPDTTRSIFRVTFPSGLVVYDTPGIFGDEKLPNENITRLFLGFPQDSSLPIVPHVPFRPDASVPTTVELSPSDIREEAPLDAVLWVVDASATLDRLTKPARKAFYLEIEKYYGSRVVVAGTHLDRLDVLPADQRNEMLELWAEVSGGHMIPVCALMKEELIRQGGSAEGAGEGLDKLVVALFRSLSDEASLTKLQESLLAERKLSRLSFVIIEASKIIASTILLDGAHEGDIRVALVTLFAIICVHYSVDEQTWRKYHGNAVMIGQQAPTLGREIERKLRDPEGFWERLLWLFGKQYFDESTRYRKLGVRGLEVLLPSLYQTLYDLESPNTPVVPATSIIQSVRSIKNKLEPLIEENRSQELANKISQLLIPLFVGKGSKVGTLTQPH